MYGYSRITEVFACFVQAVLFYVEELVTCRATNMYKNLELKLYSQFEESLYHL